MYQLSVSISIARQLAHKVESIELELKPRRFRESAQSGSVSRSSGDGSCGFPLSIMPMELKCLSIGGEPAPGGRKPDAAAAFAAVMRTRFLNNRYVVCVCAPHVISDVWACCLPMCVSLWMCVTQNHMGLCKCCFVSVVAGFGSACADCFGQRKCAVAVITLLLERSCAQILLCDCVSGEFVRAFVVWLVQLRSNDICIRHRCAQAVVMVKCWCVNSIGISEKSYFMKNRCKLYWAMYESSFC